jgi:hypothetical protein
LNTVPNCPEWQRTPGFETQDCYCVKTCKKAWPDCSYCSGSGRVGVVPGAIWCHYYAALPKFTDDPRFNPAAEADPMRELRTRAKAGEAITAITAAPPPPGPLGAWFGFWLGMVLWAPFGALIYAITH